MVEVRPRTRAASTSLQLGCLALTLCSIACSQMQHLEDNVAQELEAMADRQAALLVEHSNEGITNRGTTLSFSEAVGRASRNDEEMLALIHESRAQSLSIEQARSLRWPRLSVRVSAEGPVDASGDDAVVFGGVFIHYNLLDALLAGDAVTAESMRAQQLLLRRQSVTRRLARQLLLLVAELDAASTEAALSQQALDIADRALAKLEEEGASEGLLRGEARGWKDDRFRLAEAAWEAQWRWDLAAFRFAHMIGAGPGRVPELADGESYLPKPSGFREMKAVDREEFLRLWETREDLQAEQINLLLNEIEILNAKRSRWPQPRLSLGIGNVQLITANDTAALVPRLSLSFPLVDMGDTRRRVEKARARRDQAAAILELQARSLIKELEEARRQVELTLERLDATRRQRRTEGERRRATEELWQRGRATSLTYYASQLTDLRARLEDVRAEHRFRTAAIRFDSIRAHGPCESVIVNAVAAPSTTSGKEAQNGHPGGP